MISDSFSAALEEIDTINRQTRLLTINAQVEAARAGTVGASFAVVAAEMQNLGKATKAVSVQLNNETKHAITN